MLATLTPHLRADQAATLVRWLLWAVVAAAVCLVYFDFRSQRFSPALTDWPLVSFQFRRIQTLGLWAVWNTARMTMSSLRTRKYKQ
ncbi:hypothetical protein ACKVEX_16490 [Rhodocyclaceae bacterium SMB388]